MSLVPLPEPDRRTSLAVAVEYLRLEAERMGFAAAAHLLRCALLAIDDVAARRAG